jgi:periplasmic divalent cation tolerance protein
MRVVLCTAPADHAESIARTLVDERVAACVNVVPGIVSIYRWKGKVSRDDEVLLLVKTRDDKLAALTEAIRRVHPYEVPEIVALAPEAGEVNPEYARWVDEETG